MHELTKVTLPLSALTPLEKNAKIHTPDQIKHIGNSIKEFGMNDPIGVWGLRNIILEGNGRYLACRELGIENVVCLRLDHLTAEQIQAYAIAHNSTQQETGFDFEILKEITSNLDFDFSKIGLDINFDIDIPNIAVVEDKCVPAVLQNILQCNYTKDAVIR